MRALGFQVVDAQGNLHKSFRHNEITNLTIAKEIKATHGARWNLKKVFPNDMDDVSFIYQLQPHKKTARIHHTATLCRYCGHQCWVSEQVCSDQKNSIHYQD